MGAVSGSPTLPIEDGPSERSAGPVHPALEARVRTLLEVARARRAPLAFGHLLRMLPPGADWTHDDLRTCLDSHPSWGDVVDGYIHPDPTAGSVQDLLERRGRSAAMVQEAVRAVVHDLGPAVELTRCIGVSGSVAYGLAEPGDDLDFFVVAREGGGWLFLLLAFLRSRQAHQGGKAVAPWCFNYVVEEGAADDDFGKPLGLLVAREALSVRMLRGEEHYRRLLGRAAWIGTELPHLYAERASPERDEAPLPRLGWAVRALNLLVFPVLASYLQIVSLVGNWRLRRDSPSRCFATRTTLRRYQLRTVHFDDLTRIYRSGPTAPSD